MANRMFNQFQGSLEKGLVQLFAEVSIDGSGAPTLVRGKGVASVVKTATGVYTVTLQDSYIRTLGVAATWKLNGQTPPGAYVALDTDNVATASAPTLVLNVLDYSDVLINPGVSVVLLSVTLSNSTAL